MPTNTKENGFETLIVDYLVNQHGYEQGTNDDYNVFYTIDEARLFRYIAATQKDKADELGIFSGPDRKKFLERLNKQLSEKGVIELLRKGIKYKHLTIELYQTTPSKGNQTAEKLYKNNIFSVTRQLHYSYKNKQLALDLAIFLNGLPIITCELKNQLTKQDTEDAVGQYKKDRKPEDDGLLFSFKRCMVHFAVDDNTIEMCTELKGKDSYFLPFNKGYNDGAGNPPNSNGIKTDYFWKEILTKEELSNIIENFAQVVEEKDEDTGKVSYKQIFPRYHQLQVVKSLLKDSKINKTGARYLIQHSAGSGKSNTIAWLSHQLVNLKDENDNKIFDSVIVVTDRINLDKQIKNTIKQFMQVGSTVGWATDSGTLKQHLDSGKSIIITIVHKFQFILKDITDDYKNKNFAIVIDEAHSSQTGSLAAQMNIALSGNQYSEDDDLEDKINKLLEGKKMAKNASYYAFTATPKNKTLEMFGKPEIDEHGNPVLNENGTQKFTAHYIYTMKQAIEEGFILDVLKYYTPYQSYYKIAKTVEDDPMFDKIKAQKRLRAFVEGQEFAIQEKAEVIVEHFCTETYKKIGGQGRAMVITSRIERAIDFYFAIKKALEARKSLYKPIVAFSGDAEYNGKTYNEAQLNGFPSSKIEKTFKKDPYRILVVADKFQTGFDEPLLHTMYVDKPLYDIKAVQTLSRLNRCHSQKFDTFVLDFINDPEEIKKAFDRYYKTTILSGETDVNKLNDLVDVMEPTEVYSQEQVDKFVDLYLGSAPREKLDPILDICVENFKKLDIDLQIQFKGSAKSFVRTYNFLSSILPYGSPEWEKLSIFLNLLIGKLPKLKIDDDTDEIYKDVSLEAYRLEAQTTMAIALTDENAVIEPVPVGTPVGGRTQPDLDYLSNIIATFHDIWGNCDWTDEDKIKKQIQELPATVKDNEEYQNAMKHSDAQNARDVCERIVADQIQKSLATGLELYKAFYGDMKNKNGKTFQKWLLDMVFNATYNPDGEEIE